MVSEASEPGSESGKRSDDRRGVPRGTPQEGGASTPLAAPGSLAAAAMIYPDGLLGLPAVHGRTWSETVLDPLSLAEDLLAGRLARDSVLEGGIVEREGQSREQAEVGANGGTDQREQDVDGLAVQRAKVDRSLQEAERDHRPRHMEDDRVAHVGNGDAVADARRLQGFPGKEHTEEEFPIDLFGEAHVLDHGAEGVFLVGPGEPVEDSAGLQGFDQTRDGRRIALGLVEDGGRDVHLPGRGPFQELCPVEAVLLVDAVGREHALTDPAVDRLLGNVEELGDLSDTKLHCSPGLPISAVYWTRLDLSTLYSNLVRSGVNRHILEREGRRALGLSLRSAPHLDLRQQPLHLLLLLERRQAVVDAVVHQVGRRRANRLGEDDLVLHAPERRRVGAAADLGPRGARLAQRAGAAVLRDQDIAAGPGLRQLLLELTERRLQVRHLRPLILHLLLAARRHPAVAERSLEGAARQVGLLLVHRQLRPPRPLRHPLLVLLALALEDVLVGDRDGDLRLHLEELILHVEDDLLQQLLRVLRLVDEIVQVRAHERRDTFQQ